MHIKQALAAYRLQKSNAKRRGIEFLLTFKEWCDWWGEDIDRRGRGPDQLQMQRFGDSGPYALWNIKKGYPRDNSKTVSNVRKNKQSEKAAIARELAQDAMMYATPNEDRDELSEDEEFYQELGYPRRSGFGRGWFATSR